MLEAWLDPATNPRVVKFERNAIQTGKGIPYQSEPTIQRFLGETVLDPAGTRPRVDLTIALPIVDFLSLHFTKLINNIHGSKFGQWNEIFEMVPVF